MWNKRVSAVQGFLIAVKTRGPRYSFADLSKYTIQQVSVTQKFH